MSERSQSFISEGSSRPCDFSRTNSYAQVLNQGELGGAGCLQRPHGVLQEPSLLFNKTSYGGITSQNLWPIPPVGDYRASDLQLGEFGYPRHWYHFAEPEYTGQVPGVTAATQPQYAAPTASNAAPHGAYYSAPWNPTFRPGLPHITPSGLVRQNPSTTSASSPSLSLSPPSDALPGNAFPNGNSNQAVTASPTQTSAMARSTGSSSAVCSNSEKEQYAALTSSNAAPHGIYYSAPWNPTFRPGLPHITPPRVVHQNPSTTSASSPSLSPSPPSDALPGNVFPNENSNQAVTASPTRGASSSAGCSNSEKEQYAALTSSNAAPHGIYYSAPWNPTPGLPHISPPRVVNQNPSTTSASSPSLSPSPPSDALSGNSNQAVPASPTRSSVLARSTGSSNAVCSNSEKEQYAAPTASNAAPHRIYYSAPWNPTFRPDLPRITPPRVVHQNPSTTSASSPSRSPSPPSDALPGNSNQAVTASPTQMTALAQSTGSSSAGCSTSETEENFSIEEVEQFAKELRQKRVALGFTQADVGLALGNRYGKLFSQTTICRFEALHLSFMNMCKLKPLLQRWLNEAETSENPQDMYKTEPAVVHTIKRKKRTTFDDSVRAALEASFIKCPKPNAEEITRISEDIGLGRVDVRVWFCNRRQKKKRRLLALDEACEVRKQSTSPLNMAPSTIPSQSYPAPSYPGAPPALYMPPLHRPEVFTQALRPGLDFPVAPELYPANYSTLPNHPGHCSTPSAELGRTADYTCL